MKGAGLEVSVDAVGNVRGRLDGNATSAAGAPARRWLTGSHFDTAPDAGAFDGALGVVLSLAAVEAAVAEAAVDAGLTTNAKLAKALKAGKRVRDVLPKGADLTALLAKGVEVIAFADQEGVRFGGPLASSRALVGDYVAAGLYDRKDADGVSVAAALAAAGVKSSRKAVAAAAVPADEVEGYVEAHIEGYDKLERIGSPLGVVTAAAGSTYLLFSVAAPDSLVAHHSLVPMAERADPVAGAAEAIVAAEAACKEAAKGVKNGVLCGTGFIAASPNTPLNIASTCNFTVGVTATSDAARAAALDAVKARVDAVCKARKLACSGQLLLDYGAAVADGALSARLSDDASAALKVGGACGGRAGGGRGWCGGAAPGARRPAPPHPPPPPTTPPPPPPPLPPPPGPPPPPSPRSCRRCWTAATRRRRRRPPCASTCPTSGRAPTPTPSTWPSASLWACSLCATAGA